MGGVAAKDQVISQDLLESLKLDDADGTAMQNVAMVGWRKSRISIPQEFVAMAA